MCRFGVKIVNAVNNLCVNNLFSGDFPGGPVVQNLRCNGGDTGSIPGRRTKIPHVSRQLKACAI